MLKPSIRTFAFLMAAAFLVAAPLASLSTADQKEQKRDQFFWLGQINKATAVINTDEGLLDKSLAPGIAAGIAKVIEDGNKPGGERPATVIKFEPFLIKATGVLKNFDKILNALVISPERALEELNSDWTASQELADVLMRKYKLPFRVGHHFASEVVSYAKSNNIKPLDFPYAEAQRIYQEAVKDYELKGQLPMGEKEFRSTLDPVAIVHNRATVGGPQPAELARMLKLANGKLNEQDAWIKEKRTRIDSSLAKLDADFNKLLKSGN